MRIAGIVCISLWAVVSSVAFGLLSLRLFEMAVTDPTFTTVAYLTGGMAVGFPLLAGLAIRDICRY